MENNYYLPPDAWIYIENQYEQPELQPNHRLNNDTTKSTEMEPEVDWEQWIQESAMETDAPVWNPNIGTMSPAVDTQAIPSKDLNTNWLSQEENQPSWVSDIESTSQRMDMTTSPSTVTLDANWLDQQLSDPMADSTESSTLNELYEIEDILFSSPECSQRTYASTPTSSNNTHSNSSDSTSPSTSTSQPTPTSTSTTPPQAEEFYPCTTCPRTFPKRHLLNRHLKTHNPSITCPFRPRGCLHLTARNRDMARHIAVHHPLAAPPATAPPNQQAPMQNPKHFCPVRGCVVKREGFTRQDNLGRHLRNVHGLRMADIG